MKPGNTIYRVRSALYSLLPQPLVKLIRTRILIPVRTVRCRRIPIAMITGTSGKTTTTRMLAHILTVAGHRVGYTTTDGVVINGQYLNHEDSAGYQGAATVLRDPSITAAVLETARGGLLHIGLYINHCSVAALLNVDREQIEMGGIESVEQMADLKRKVLDVADQAVVLNSDDPQCVRLLPRYPPGMVKTFSVNTDNPVSRSIIEQGGVSYVLTNNNGHSCIERRDRNSIEILITLAELPSCANGLFTQNIKNAMAAAALAEGLQVPIKSVRQGLQTFKPSVEQSPGRINIIEGYAAGILIDRAVTVPSCEALMNSLKSYPIRGRKICMVDTIGNRPEWHYTELSRMLAGYFDELVCCENEKYRRNRQVGEINSILKEGFLKEGIPSKHIQLARDIEEAIISLSKVVRPDDFVVILNSGSNPDDILMLIERYFLNLKTHGPDSDN